VASIKLSQDIVRGLLGAACLIAGAGGLNAQTDSATPESQPAGRGFGALSNYTVSRDLTNVKPMSSGEKWKLGTFEAFGPASFLLAGATAGIGQADNKFPTWGQGAEGFGKRYGAAFADRVVDNYLTGAVFPILLHEDPRYFRMGHGPFFHRLGYAVGRIAVARTDAGSSRANYSEFLGSAVAAGISNVYYPSDQRTFGYTAQTFGVQLATDTLFNVLKEFWPDVHHKLSKSGRTNPQSASLVP
jgi:hypothetical protein